MTSEIISEEDYLRLRRDARVLEADSYGDKVLLLADGRIMKLFRIKKLLSGARIVPYSRRFAINRERLVARGIPTVSEVRCFKLPSRQRHGVFYQPLPGETLRRLGMNGRLDAAQCTRAGDFIAGVHAKGILFRSIHLGNIVLGEDGALGLIDIADLSQQPWPLRRDQRLRNFRHLFRPPQERRYLNAELRQALLDGYLAVCPPRLFANERFRTGLRRIAMDDLA